MKKTILVSLVFVLAIILSGCLAKKPLMDKPAADNNYYYQNSGLGFSLVLPPEFVYYQTQRKELSGYVELAIFVPTSDTLYQQEVPGYAKPISVRIYGGGDWNKLNKQEKAELSKAGEKGGKIYAISFWQRLPNDWKGKWSEQMKDKIIKGFKTE